MAKSSNLSATISRPRGLCAIFNHLQVILLGNPHHLGHLTGLAIKMSWNNCASLFRDRTFQLRGVEIECCRIDIDEHGYQAGLAGNFRHYPKCECRKENFASVRKVKRAENIIKGHSSKRSGVGAFH